MSATGLNNPGIPVRSRSTGSPLNDDGQAPPPAQESARPNLQSPACKQHGRRSARSVRARLGHCGPASVSQRGCPTCVLYSGAGRPCPLTEQPEQGNEESCQTDDRQLGHEKHPVRCGLDLTVVAISSSIQADLDQDTREYGHEQADRCQDRPSSHGVLRGQRGLPGPAAELGMYRALRVGWSSEHASGHCALVSAAAVDRGAQTLLPMTACSGRGKRTDRRACLGHVRANAHARSCRGPPQ